MPNERKCTWCDKSLGLDDGLCAAGDAQICDNCLINLNDDELLRDTSLLRLMLERSANEPHCTRIHQLLLKQPDNVAWTIALRPPAMNDRVADLAVCWLQLNVANPKLYFVGPFAESESPSILRALLNWIKKGGQGSRHMPALLADFMKASAKFDTASRPQVLKVVRRWLKSNPGDEFAGQVYSVLISITNSPYDIGKAKQWYLKHKENRFAWKVIDSWLNVAYRYSIKHQWAIDEAKELLKSEEQRAKLPGLVGSLVGVMADVESVGWAKKAYEQTGMPWILVRVLKQAPEQSLIEKAEESSSQWIESGSEEEMLYALFKANPGNEFAYRQTMSFVERHPGYEFAICSFCGEANDDVDHMIQEQDAYICSGCTLSLRASLQDLNTGIPANCSFCHELQHEVTGSYKHKICRECLELALDVIRGEEIGEE